MNERIKLLRKYALNFCYDNGGEPENLNKEFCEKFAELIVRECAEVIDAQKPVWQNTDVPAEIALDMAAKNIKAYFGVEE